MVKITIKDTILSYVKISDSQQIKSPLTYEAIGWRTGRFGKEKNVYKKVLKIDIDYKKDRFYFLTGNVHSVTNYLTKMQIEWKIENKCRNQRVQIANAPNLPGITFREDQWKLLESSLSANRGVILSPTGSGKTIIQAGICSSLSPCNVLLVTHLSGIVDQSIEEFRRFGFNVVSHRNLPLRKMEKRTSTQVCIATINSIHKLNYNDVWDLFDVIIIDECHRVKSLDSMYGQMLTNIEAGMRYGFTASLPDELSRKIMMEGLIGPVLEHFTINEAKESKILAKPHLHLLRMPIDEKLTAERLTYREVYERAVVNNRRKNRLILQFVNEQAKKNKVSLIMVSVLDHVENIYNMGKNVFGLKIRKVTGKTTSNKRAQIKQQLNSKTIDAVVCTSAWREGIDIPELDVVVYAAGGKADSATLQAMGRGLRRTKNKPRVSLVDIIDNSHYYLTKHFGERIGLYYEMGWMDCEMGEEE